MKLTKQEQKIANMIARGLDNKTIANDLYIEQSTLKTHILSLYKKFNIKKTTSTNNCRSLLVAKILQKQIIHAKNQLDVAEQLHEESLKFMQPNINLCRKFLELYQNEIPCINCPVELIKADCNEKKDICLQRIWDLMK